ncbi:GNAT family N-acetyltransferase [Dyadobacter luteus]|jgi:GNAT superfamily N-acetyltransferase|uniref:GNAT family N-acetyltransferase n=1 Tax=Dyadobacter luteus TaxID=2259619 RepID=A0A3D8YCQ9_9BACT|nr:GNAT family N-acetyltransferase [Dyadobacter luteus]REA62307.1 GNAT family N-acetyltransferase [Dyadobacter luteus]
MKKENLTFIRKTGSEIESVFDDLAALRIAVFHDFPYLYEGSVAYEKEYLKIYSNSKDAFLFAVYDGDKMVGATTCIPLTDETDEVKKPFIDAGSDVSKIFYFGESILLHEYRGLGLGHRFFDERESHAKSFDSYSLTCFCSVDRADNHPAKPTDYRPNDLFWIKRGYQKEPSLVSYMQWLDIGDNEETLKKMVFWVRELQGL